MLGLQRGTVELVPHSTTWAFLFAQEKSQLGAALGDKALDMAVAVADLTVVAGCVPVLKALGYAYFGDRGGKGDHFSAKGSEQKRTHHVHMVKHCASEWTACLLFRDYLITNAEARQRYSRLKHRLLQRHASDREAYTEGKAALVRSLLRKASGEVS